MNRWKAELEDMSIPVNLIENKMLEAPVLKDGDEKAEGGKNITTYLEKLAVFVKGWYECRCDNYPFI